MFSFQDSTGGQAGSFNIAVQDGNATRSGYLGAYKCQLARILKYSLYVASLAR